MAQLAIVGFYLGLNALLFFWLSAKVIGIRRSDGVSIGDGENKQLAHFIRGQGNAAEYMPIFFIMLGIAALLNTPPIALHIMGLVFTVGRFLHASWFLKPSSNLKPRIAGMMLTFIAIIVLALGLIAHAVMIISGGY